MNTLNWKEVWNRRSFSADEKLSLDALIKLDGFDSGAGRIDADDWQTYANIISEKLEIKNGDSIYELGCGAGAFLFALREKQKLKVGGLDYSSALIEAATHAMPDGDFVATEAMLLNTEPVYDFVISNSVFHYFSQDYAAAVLARMVQKAKVAVAIMEVPDLKTKAESEALRRDLLSQEEYEKKYAGLEHTYYDRDWFKSQAARLDCSCETFDGCVPGYAQNRFRFGTIIKKH